MAHAYWVAFRIAAVGDGKERFRRVFAAVHDLAAGTVWCEMGTFVVFRSDASLKKIASEVEAALDPATDTAMVGKPDFRRAITVGLIQNDGLFELLPGTRSLRD